MTTLYLVRGLPGSGKSTLAKQLAKEVCEADEYFMHAGKYLFDADKLPEAHRRCKDNTSRLLRTGADVAVANTFTTIKELRPYFEMSYWLLDKPPVVYHCQNSFGNVHGVGQELLDRMQRRFAYDISELYRKELNHETTIS